MAFSICNCLFYCSPFVAAHCDSMKVMKAVGNGDSLNEQEEYRCRNGLKAEEKKPEKGIFV